MPVIEFIGALAGAYMSATVWSHPLNNLNEAFAHRVDRGRSCFTRVAGEPGSYGKPSNYDLDLICNWRLKKVTKTGPYDSWELTRG
jgi:hypothetical protein